MQAIILATTNFSVYVKCFLKMAEVENIYRNNYAIKYKFVDTCVSATDGIYFQYLHQKIEISPRIFRLSM
jgi:hypothetical protein